MSAIGVAWVGAGEADASLLELVRAHVAREFVVPALVVRGGAPHGPLGFDAKRGQWLTKPLLDWLAEHRPSGIARLLGLTDVDLFIPILTHVFGEARLRGRVALVSTARLAAGMSAEPELRLARLRTVKEATHELGHTFGLLHCDDLRCVMARSTTTRHVDAKRAHLCAPCRACYDECGPSPEDES